MEQATNQSLPWTKNFSASGLFNFYSVSASVTTGTTVTCSITVDGVVKSTHTSTGQYSNVNCTASAN